MAKAVEHDNVIPNKAINPKIPRRIKTIQAIAPKIGQHKGLKDVRVDICKESKS
jgi:hypothetical protein